MRCGWCDGKIKGEPVDEVVVTPLTWSDGEVEIEMAPGHNLGFCCHGCAWANGMDSHQLMGMSGKEARDHLMEMHGLEPGKARGGQGRRSLERSRGVAESLLRVVFGKEVRSSN